MCRDQGLPTGGWFATVNLDSFLHCNEPRFFPEQSDKASPPQGTVWAPNLPLYPSGHVAIEELFSTRLGIGSAYEGVLSALVPDYRGKIAEIRLVNDGVTVRVTSLAGANPKDLARKLYGEGYRGIGFTEDLASCCELCWKSSSSGSQASLR